MIEWLVQTAADLPAAGEGLLGPDERRAYAALRTEKRRQEWLLGRWTAKLLLQRLIRARCGETVPLAALQVLNGRTRAPVVRCDGVAELPVLSVSHSNRHAFCAALERPSPPIGADIERIEPRSATFVADYFTAAERALVAQAPPDLQATAVTAIWSAKEAALKALQVGLSIDTRRVTCLVRVETAVADWTPFAIEVDWDDKLRQHGQSELRGWWRVQEGFVLTLVA